MKRQLAPFCFDSIVLRPLAEDDLSLTLAWRNRSDARQWFRTNALITAESHQAWFSRYLALDNDFTFVVERLADGARLGQAAIYNVDFDARRAEVGRFLVAPDHAGRGWMKQACCAVQALGKKMLALEEFHLEVRVNNERAIHIYRSCGFVEADTDDGMLRMSTRVSPQ